jgi:hypothetical protein
MPCLPRLVRLFLFHAAVLSSCVLHAAGTAEVKAVRYPAWIEAGEQKTPLQPGMRVRPGDQLVSGDDARVLLGLPDGSEMKLGQKARLTISRLSTSGIPGGVELDLGLSLLSGKFRYAAGAIAKLTGRRKVDLKLATATIGIRGTDYWAMTDKEHDAVCLFEGKVEVETQEQESIVLDKPTAFWSRFFDKPAQPPGNATAADLAQFLGWVEIAPSTGVAVEGGRWRVIAGAEKSTADAQELNRTLRTQGYPAAVARSYGLYEVRINAFATRADAEALLKKLQATSGLLGSDPRVVVTR